MMPRDAKGTNLPNLRLSMMKQIFPTHSATAAMGYGINKAQSAASTKYCGTY
jgi:hypothetical protein